MESKGKPQISFYEILQIPARSVKIFWPATDPSLSLSLTPD